MLDTTVLAVKERSSKTPKGVMKKSRQTGVIPAVVYGADKGPTGLWVTFRDIERVLQAAHSANVLFDLEVAGSKASAKKDTVLLKEIQKDPVSGSPLHIDFLRIKLTQKIEVEVPVRLVGEAKGVKNKGGILEHLLREIAVRTLPAEIPEAITLDVTELEIGHGLLVKDLKIPKGVEVLTDENHVVVNVVAPAKEEAAPVPVEAVAAQEPEVIAKGKKEAVEGVLAQESAKTQQPATPVSAKSESPTKK